MLGRGIAVVAQTDDKEISVLLWDRSLLTISREDIVWNRQNRRWESEPKGIFQGANQARE